MPLYRSLGSAFSMLSEAAALTLPQVALFAAPFLLDAAAAVVELPAGADLYDGVDELVDAYLLEFESDSGPGPGTGTEPGTGAEPGTDAEPGGGGGARLTMREPVRSFALDQLDAGQLDAARGRHARYFRDRARAGVEVAARDWPDIAAALDFAFAHGSVDDALILGVAAAPSVRGLSGAGAQLRARLDELAGPASTSHTRVDPALRTRAMVWSTALFPTVADELVSVGLWTARQLRTATAR